MAPRGHFVSEIAFDFLLARSTVEQLDGRKFLLLTYFFCNYFPKSFAHSISVGVASSA